nr:MAG TPA: hypothetical protein [Caudoviricetes sp.]
MAKSYIVMGCRIGEIMPCWRRLRCESGRPLH